MPAALDAPMRLDESAAPAPYRPPMPTPANQPLPPWRLLWAVLFNPLHVWRAQHFEDPLVVERTPMGTRLVISDPALIKWILVDNHQNYVRDNLQRRLLHRVTGQSLFSAQGEAWQLQRKLLAPHFAAKSVETYLPAMASVADAAVGRLRRQGDTPFDIRQEMWRLSVEVIERTLFPDGIGESAADIAANLNHFAHAYGHVEMGDLLGLPAAIPGLRRLIGWRAGQRVRQRARRLLAAAKAAGPTPRSGFLSPLIAARHPSTGAPLDDRIIEDNISAMIGAGSDTASVALAWSLFLLAQVPHVRALVEAEVDTLLTPAGVTADNLGKLVWTRAVIEETMRLYPPAPMIGRVSLKDDVLGGRPYPAGTTILIAPWVLHRHRRLWRDADLFIPERFLPGQREQIPRYAYLPFGAGPRICLGMGLAMQEAVTLLATLVKELRFECADAHPVHLRHCMTLHADPAIRMRVRARHA
ncbi:MAG: cytochrome P450 [Rhodocyclales bacterium GT-UBC]|nr:MAG: cytochrome P450 [Rhodocyclales bacterium GT-UBC]